MCNIAGGLTDSNLAVCNAGGMELFHKLLKTQDKDYFDVALYGLANIAGEYIKNRNRLIKQGVLDSLIGCYITAKEMDLLENYGFCLRNMVRYRYEFEEMTVNNILDVVMQTLEVNCSTEITHEFLEVVGYLTLYSLYAQHVISTEPYVDILMSYYEHSAYEIQEKANRAIATLATGTHEMTQTILNKRVLDRALCLLQTAKSPLRKEIAWLLSNIAAGTQSQISELLSHSIITSGMKFLIDTDLIVKKEATYIFHNLAQKAAPDQLIKLVSLGILEYLQEALNSIDAKIVLVIAT